jgi:hypothetical protein
MAFPPTFTNNWDVTFPPDTQLANLLGQDIRSLKTDIMQRLSLLSGILSNRPTPETVNASWGGAGYGLLYFATDTGQVFQWSGVAWVDVSLSIFPPRTIFKDTTLHTHTGDTTLDTIYTVPVAAGLLGTNGTLRITIEHFMNVQTNTGNTVVFVKFGGTIISSYVFQNGAGPSKSETILSNRGVTNSQVSSSVTLYSASPFNVPNNSTAAIDTTVAQNLLIQVQNFANSDSQRFDQCIVELL